MNWQQVEDSWNDLRGKVHKKWANLTEEDLTAIRGKRDELVKRIQQRYPIERAKAEQVSDEFVRNLR